MNYIPGFSNYLQASVPRYAQGGRARYDEDIYDMGGYAAPYVAPPIMGIGSPAAATAAPTEVPFDPSTFDLSKLDFSGFSGIDDSLYGLNFASNFGGGAMGGIYKDDPNTEYITAPISNRGDFTSPSGNVFVMRADQPVRLVDRNTNKVVFEGVGYDAARKATELGQGITDARGRKANYIIQTANPSGEFTTVAHENRNKTFLGEVANVVGTALPIAVSLIPGLQFAGPVLSAALAGGAGAALKGDDILKGALIGGATAGITSGTGLDKAIGGALSGVGKGVTQGVTQGAAQGLGNAAGDIVVTGLSKGLQAAGGALGQAALSQVGKAGLSEITGYKPPAEQFAQQPLPPAFQPPVDDTINVIANKAASAVPNYGGALANAFAPIATDFLPKGGLPEPLPSEPMAPEPVDDSIIVNANRASGSGLPFGASLPVPVDAILSGALTAAQPATTQQPETVQAVEEEPGTIVTGAESLTPEEMLAALGGVGGLAAATAGGVPTDPAAAEKADAEAKKKKLGLEEYLRLAGLASGLLGGAAGGGSGQTGRYGGSGSGRLNPIFSAKLPPASGLGVIGANRTPRALGDQDWLTYGTRPELNFYDYAAQPVPNNPAGPIMRTEEPVNFARGGRTEFAVNGPGTGRSDDIPAVLSDGEYVIDAETVALLGDGSSKAGAKKLDELRVKVRKHKGKKLAKGRFSANAKRPEAYLSGGRV
jgi:hypothetical protein